MNNKTIVRTSLTFAAVFFMVAALAHISSAAAASNLALSPGLSFDDDSSPTFPIGGKNLSDGSVRAGKATVIFF
ncbi:MAG: hypothetical protein JO071_09790, partial [Deltaproteobacteria bacterium]|nr:hypothetical protein [Deltaproteobacteria bacterium]